MTETTTKSMAKLVTGRGIDFVAVSVVKFVLTATSSRNLVPLPLFVLISELLAFAPGTESLRWSVERFLNSDCKFGKVF
jgi:hypothetical protein